MMVVKDEVWRWFRDSEPHRRLELLCGLLNMCLPMELRFISTCVEDLGKRDFHDLREAESKANNTQEIKRLSNLLDERTRSNLIVYTALLTARNHPCSSLLYQVLSQDTQDPPLTEVNHVKEMLLIYTMVLHHPAFTFEQKRVIAELHGRASRQEVLLSQQQEGDGLQQDVDGQQRDVNSQLLDVDSRLLDALSQGCGAVPEGCDSGLSVGTEPEGDALLEGCPLLSTPPSQLQYHQHAPNLPKSVGGLGTAHTSEGGGSQDACSTGSGESNELYSEGGTVSTTYIYNSSIFEQQRLVALTMAPSYTCSHHGNLHYYQYPQMVGGVAGSSSVGKGSNSEGSSGEDCPNNGPAHNGPPTSNSPFSSPQSSPYVSPLQSLSPSRASSPLSRPTATATTTTTTTTTAAASFPPTVTSSTSSANPGQGTHLSPRSSHKCHASVTQPAVITQTSVTHTSTHSGNFLPGQMHRGKPPSSGSRSQRQSDRSGSRSRLPTGSSGDSETAVGNQNLQNSPTTGRGMPQTTHSTNNNNNNYSKGISRWSGNNPATTTSSTSALPNCAAPVNTSKCTIRQNSQSPCPASSTVTICKLPSATVMTSSSPASKTTNISSPAGSGSFSSNSISSSANSSTRNTSPPVIHGGSHEKSAHTISTNSGIRSLPSTGGCNATNPPMLEKCPVNNNNCLNQEYVKHERLSKYYPLLQNYPIDELKKMTDREILELGLTKGALSKLRRVLAKLESFYNHIPNGFTNPAVLMRHQHSSSHHTSHNSPSHAPSYNHLVVSTAAHISNNPQTCSHGQQSTTANQAKVGPTEARDSSQCTSQKAKTSPSNTLSNCKDSPVTQSSSTNNITHTGSSALLQVSPSSIVTGTATLSSNPSATITSTTTTTTTPTTTTTLDNSMTTSSSSVVTTSTASASIASTTHVTQCHSVTISSSQKGTTTTNQQPPIISSDSAPLNTSLSSHGTNTTCITPATSQTRSSVLTPVSTSTPMLHYMNTPPPPFPHKTTPPPTGLVQHQPPPPGQHRTSPPSLCGPSRAPSQEPSTSSTSSGLAANNTSQQVHYSSNGPGGKSLPGVNSNTNTAASLSMNVASYTTPMTGNPPHSTGGSVAMPIYTSAGSMPVYTSSSSSMGVPPPSNGGLVPMVPPGSQYPTYLYSVLGNPGGTPSYVPPGPYGVQHPPRYFFPHMPQMGHMTHLKATSPHPGVPLTSMTGSRGGSSSSSSSSSSSGSTRGVAKGNPRGHSHIKASSRSSDSSPSSSQYSSPPQTPSPDHTRDNLPDKRGKAHGDEICEAGEPLGLLGSGASEEGTPPPFHHPPNPVLLPPQATLPRPRGIPYPHLGVVSFHHGGAMRYPGLPLPNQAPLIAPRNSLPLNSDKSSRETTPPAPGTMPLVPQDPHCCVRSPSEGITVPSTLSGTNHGRNGGSPHTTASHSDGSQPPVTHTPVPSVASAPTVQVPPGNSCTGAPHSSVQYNAPGYPVVLGAPMFPQFPGIMPTHSSLSNGFVSPPMPPNFAFPNMGNGLNPEFVYSGQYPTLGGTTQGGGGPSPPCGTPAGIGAPTPGPGLAAGLPYTHYPPNLPHTPNPSAGAKKTCYNCGQVGHHGAECKEANIEEMCNLPKATRS